MSEFLRILIDGVLDAFEEFFESIVSPSRQFIKMAFLISLAFLGFTAIGEVAGFTTFVTWQEALTCSIIMLGITLIDASFRVQIVSGLKSITSKLYDTSKFQYADGEDLDENDYDEEQELEVEEVSDDGEDEETVELIEEEVETDGNK